MPTKETLRRLFRLAYRLALILSSAVLLVSAPKTLPNAVNELFILAVLSLLLALVPLFPFADLHVKIESRSESLAFLFIGAILLSPLSFLLLVLLYEGIDSLQERITSTSRFSFTPERLFEAAILFISGSIAKWLLSNLAPIDSRVLSFAYAISVLLAAIGFVLVYYLWLRILLGLSSRRSTYARQALDRRRIIRGIFFLGIATVGVLLWNEGVWLIPLALAQLTLVYRAVQAIDLRRQAQTDTKTGLWNARYFNSLLAAEFNRAARFKRPMALMVADIDRFKEINTTYGHLVGDEVIASIGELVNGNVRQYDIAGRFGGDEFVIMLPETHRTEALNVAERLRQAVATATFPINHTGTHAQLTMSVGVAVFPQDASTPIELLTAADLALYQAKEEGRNRIVDASDLSTDKMKVLEPVAEKWLGTFSVPSIASNPFSKGRLNSSPILGSEKSRVALASLQTIFIFGVALLIGGLILANVATRNATPGEALYPVKRTFEAVQLAIVVDDTSKAQLHIALARVRLQEIEVLRTKGQYELIPETLAAYTEQMQSATSSLAQTESDPENAVSIASKEVQVLTDATNVLNTLLVASPPETRPHVEQALSITADNAKIARTKLSQAMVMLVDLTPTPTSTSQPTPVSTNPSQIVYPPVTPLLPATMTIAPTETLLPTLTAEPTNRVASETPSSATTLEVPTETPTLAIVTEEATPTILPTQLFVPPTSTPTIPAPGQIQNPTKTLEPTFTPTLIETLTKVPTSPPTETQLPTFTPAPSRTPTPTEFPTATPTATDQPVLESPTEPPTDAPTETWTPVTPTVLQATPTESPTSTPTDTPTATPTDTPTETWTPTEIPTEPPTEAPTETATASPTETWTWTPTETSTDVPTETWTPEPSPTPTEVPIDTSAPTPTDTPEPTDIPKPTDTLTPTDTPEAKPNQEASETLTMEPTKEPVSES
ncbi:MAG TPA: diguanylate cyclase [Anaerolineae bacterium]|nr:diguanylate cyclase [Anaerolineae bacterium]